MKIIIEYLLISMLITFLFLWFLQPNPQIIVKYPNIKDKISDLYIDDSGTCYRYRTTEAKCLSNP